MAAVALASRLALTSLRGTRLLLPAQFNLTRPLTSQQGSLKVDKSLLSKLRKETGFGFSKCLESLQHCNNDYSAALSRLEAEAEKQGWEKATKLQGRATSEGLIGISVEGNFAAMVEVNCETDFVARNDLFVGLVSKVANAAMVKRKKIVKQNKQLNAFGRQLEHLREVIPEHKLRSEEIQHGNGETVADCMARTVGQLGENIKVNKVVTMTTKADNVIGHYVHGPFVTSLGMCSLGRYGSIVALKSKTEGVSVDSMLCLANGLARHVVGMNPRVIREDGSPPQSSKQDGVSDVLLEQEYLLDDSLLVGDLLNREGVEVVDFVRYECSGSS